MQVEVYPFSDNDRMPNEVYNLPNFFLHIPKIDLKSDFSLFWSNPF